MIRRSCDCGAGVSLEGDKAQQLADAFVARHQALGHSIVQRAMSAEGRAPRQPSLPDVGQPPQGRGVKAVQVKKDVL
jgi:hypothetical protein